MKKHLASDIKAGIVVYLVALPLCLGISMACGVPLLSGIIAGIIGGILVTSISNSRFSVSGPAAGLTVIVIHAITDLGSLPLFFAAVVAAGTIQITLGLLRAGNICNFVPNAVIKGMLAGIGIILILKQLPHLVGYDADPEGDLFFHQTDGETSLTELGKMLQYVTPGSVVVSIVSFILLFIAQRKFYRRDPILSYIPGPLLVVIFGILMCISFRGFPALKITSEHLVQLPLIRTASDLRESLTFPDFQFVLTTKFWLIAFTIAIIASLETLLSIEAIEKLDPDKHQTNPNRELIAQGTGNMVSGLLGGLPLTSVIVRSSANITAGAKTKISVLLHAVLLLLSVLFLAQVLCLIPNSSLAVILIFTGYKLAKVSLFTFHFKMGMDQFLPFITTIIVMLGTDMLKGVGAGLVVSVIYIIRFNLKSTFETAEEEIEGRKVYLIRLPQHATFFNKGFMSEYLSKIPEHSRVIIDGTINKSTDKDVLEVLSDFKETTRKRNITLQLVKYSI
jgi:MFS superfamily sulfate permease-like transporter